MVLCWCGSKFYYTFTSNFKSSFNMFDFIQENWVIISLVASELLAFVPSKFNGLAQSAFKIVSIIFGKKAAKK